ncbi:hypothetical protein IFM89_019985 [Coptis chinensis]|uniref:Uncharacterized protein n=1 Tax=Coptis chinensis TaxID=261450 RepID=A0A835LWH2_9MAGN|nr:hypothetical protein IFM89_019985 [Coptis chinensis]
MAATQHVIAMENKFKSGLEVGRAEVYIRAHTKKNKTIQCPEITISLQTLGKDKSGCMRGMGTGISSTMVKKTALVLKKNEELRCENTTTNSKLDRLETELQMVKDMIVASQPASQTQRNHVSETPTTEVPLRQPSQVASGQIVAVNPQSIVHGRPMGEGVFKILLTEVVDSEARVFFPNDFATTLGEVGSDCPYVHNLRRSVREAALSLQSCDMDSLRDNHSYDGSTHFFIPFVDWIIGAGPTKVLGIKSKATLSISPMIPFLEQCF